MEASSGRRLSDEAAEKKIRKRLCTIHNLAEPQLELPSAVFGELVNVIDDISLEYPEVSRKVESVAQMASQCVRLRCHGIAKNDSDLSVYSPCVEPPTQIVQRIIADSDVLIFDQQIPLIQNQTKGRNVTRNYSSKETGYKNRCLHIRRMSSTGSGRSGFSENGPDETDYGFFEIMSASSYDSSPAPVMPLTSPIIARRTQRFIAPC